MTAMAYDTATWLELTHASGMGVGVVARHPPAAGLRPCCPRTNVTDA